MKPQPLLEVDLQSEASGPKDDCNRSLVGEPALPKAYRTSLKEPLLSLLVCGICLTRLRLPRAKAGVGIPQGPYSSVSPSVWLGRGGTITPGF